VIVAGAGSGKTTVMAARVVWLVGTGQVAPEQVLGLTFTNKAAGELAERVRKALIKAGVTDPDHLDPDNPPGEPVISTYHAFAGRLLTDHGLPLGLGPTSPPLADAPRYQPPAPTRPSPAPSPTWSPTFSPSTENSPSTSSGPRTCAPTTRTCCVTWRTPSSATPTCARSPRPPPPAASWPTWSCATGPPNANETCSTSATRSRCPPGSRRFPTWAARCGRSSASSSSTSTRTPPSPSACCWPASSATAPAIR